MIVFADDEVVRKAAQDKSLGALSPRSSWHVGERGYFLFEQIEGSVKSLREFYAQSGPLFFVPGRGFKGLLSSLFKNL